MASTDIMRDMVITAIGGYNWDQLKPFVLSLEHSGFTGHKVAIVYNLDADTTKKLIEYGWSLVGREVDESGNFTSSVHPATIVVDRFASIWHLLSAMTEEQMKKIDWVISVDCRDVIFQDNPSAWLYAYTKGYQINVGSEGLLYKDEPWGNDNMLKSFGPAIHGWMKEKEIVNCGTFAAQAPIMKDLSLAIYMLCAGAKIHNPDQAALNVLLNMEPYKWITKVNKHRDSWSCQVGTVADPSKMEHFRSKLTEGNPQPNLDLSDGLVYPDNGKIPFCLVHQYDRNEIWNQIILKKYKGE